MLKKVLIGFAVAAVVLLAAKNVIAKLAVSAGVGAVTGAKLEMRSLEVGLFRSRVHAQGVKLHNPKGFPEKIMADLPELYVDYDLPAFFTGKTHLRELRVHLKEFIVVKDAQGRVNLESLKPVQKAKEEGKEKKPKPETKPGAFRIDDLHLKVGKVIYKDYSGGGAPRIEEFPVNLDEHHQNVNDPTALGALIVTRALFKTGVAKLANLDLRALESYGHGLLKATGTAIDAATKTATGAAGTAVDTAGGVLEGAGEALQNLNPFGQGDETKQQQ